MGRSSVATKQSNDSSETLYRLEPRLILPGLPESVLDPIALLPFCQHDSPVRLDRKISHGSMSEQIRFANGPASSQDD